MLKQTSMTKKDKTCTKIMDETTLRIYFPEGYPNADRPSLKLDNINTTPDNSTASKANKQSINIQGQNLLLIFLSP